MDASWPHIGHIFFSDMIISRVNRSVSFRVILTIGSLFDVSNIFAVVCASFISCSATFFIFSLTSRVAFWSWIISGFLPVFFLGGLLNFVRRSALSTRFSSSLFTYSCSGASGGVSVSGSGFGFGSSITIITVSWFVSAVFCSTGLRMMMISSVFSRSCSMMRTSAAFRLVRSAFVRISSPLLIHLACSRRMSRVLGFSRHHPIPPGNIVKNLAE